MNYILDELENSNFNEYSIMVLPDHYTPIYKRTHVANPVPFLIYRNYQEYNRNRFRDFSEKIAEKSDLFIENGYKLINHFLGDTKKYS